MLGIRSPSWNNLNSNLSFFRDKDKMLCSSFNTSNHGSGGVYSNLVNIYFISPGANSEILSIWREMNFQDITSIIILMNHLKSWCANDSDFVFPPECHELTAWRKCWVNDGLSSLRPSASLISLQEFHLLKIIKFHDILCVADCNESSIWTWNEWV